MTTLDPHYVDPTLVDLYDPACGWSADRDFYLALAGPSPARVLDLGCGTGLICDAWAARGHVVTGVDPAASMLAVARAKPNGDRIDWVQSSAEAYRSDRRFDLIVMTGHAFQVLLDDAAVLATFETMRRHLAPGGVAAFESRNPRFDWRRRWDSDRPLTWRGQPVIMATRWLRMQGEFLDFEIGYRFPDRTLLSPSRLRFLDRAGIEARLVAAGLVVDNVFGTWDAKPFDEAADDEMIFIVRAK